MNIHLSSMLQNTSFKIFVMVIQKRTPPTKLLQWQRQRSYEMRFCCMQLTSRYQLEKLWNLMYDGEIKPGFYIHIALAVKMNLCVYIVAVQASVLLSEF